MADIRGALGALGASQRVNVEIVNAPISPAVVSETMDRERTSRARTMPKAARIGSASIARRLPSSACYPPQDAKIMQFKMKSGRRSSDKRKRLFNAKNSSLFFSLISVPVFSLRTCPLLRTLSATVVQFVSCVA